MPPASKASRAKQLLLLRRRSSLNPDPLLPSLPLPLPLPSRTKTLKPSPSPSSSSPRRLFCSDGILERIILLTEKPVSIPSDREVLLPEISALADALVAAPDPPNDLHAILDSHSAASLLRRSPDGFASLELLSRLKHRPLLALEVFEWRRKQADSGLPILLEEYTKAIAHAGHTKNPDLASDLFYDARAGGIHDPRIYNALMSAYMYNGLTNKSLAVFEDLKQDACCSPTIVTYNILLSIFGRSMLIDHMEAVLRTVQLSGLARNLSTYNTVIAGYVTAWMWDRMESTFRSMEVGPIKPDAYTHLLMLRGYAYAGNLEKMERMYELVREQVNDREVHLIRVMICAYCKSSDPERVKKIEVLTKYIPEDEYRPWLNALLIRVYAQEGLVEAMERFISEALHRNTAVTALGIMHSIISSYFKCNAVERLAGFVKQSENAGWRLCRSLYHTKMVMYGRQNRLKEMHNVLDEMEAYHFYRTKKTFVIMYKAYSNLGRRYEVETIAGLMWKHGFGSPGAGDAAFFY